MQTSAFLSVCLGSGSRADQLASGIDPVQKAQPDPRAEGARKPSEQAPQGKIERTRERAEGAFVSTFVHLATMVLDARMSGESAVVVSSG
ncbi:hypothetical protein [uncultured Senegalimassilia sp.]|uniref:hypothetical protein n=1 Tax=uncultured Senegalimassilia sp. TaxID=1714350 RepID=UPI002604ADE3|nr:hypothetical protein [uncultured Senegalimassilia sp.]